MVSSSSGDIFRRRVRAARRSSAVIGGRFGCISAMVWARYSGPEWLLSELRHDLELAADGGRFRSMISISDVFISKELESMVIIL